MKKIIAVLFALAVATQAYSAAGTTGGLTTPASTVKIWESETVSSGTTFTMSTALTPVGVLLKTIKPTGMLKVTNIEVFFPGLSATATGRANITVPGNLAKGICKMATSTNAYCVWPNVSIANLTTTSVWCDASDGNIIPVISIEGY